MARDSAVRLGVIVAAAENGVIGRGNALPWHLPEDLRYFRQVTMGKPIIMGRKTHQSIGRPLPGRSNIVITGDAGFDASGVAVVSSLDAAINLAREIAGDDGAEEVLVIGGAEIYRLTLPRADRLYLTEVHARVEGDVSLPPIDWAHWRELRRERHAAGDGNPYDYSFVVLERLCD